MRFPLLCALALLLSSAVEAFDRYNVLQHQSGDQGDWFEWWYYKAIADDGTPFYWVYGVVNPWDFGQSNPASKAYVGVGNFETLENFEQKFAVKDFEAAYDKTEIRVGDFYATDRALTGAMPSPGGTIQWQLDLQKEWGWNAMGWGLPLNSLSNISWYPAQALSLMNGWLNYQGKIYEFHNAKAYQDRNWGRSFPDWWFWLVSNHFNERADATVVCGGGLPRVLGMKPMPVINCGLKALGKELSFRSHDYFSYDYDIGFGRWEIVLKNALHKLKLSAVAPTDRFLDLVFVSPQNTEFHDLEALDGYLKLELYERKLWGWQKSLELTSNYAGIEFGAEHPRQSIKSDLASPE
jgi:hypothetical protein